LEGIHLSREETARLSNYGIPSAQVLNGNIGYVEMTGFYHPDEGVSEALQAAMHFLSHTVALILDFRNNGGGSPKTAVLLVSYFFDAPDKPLFKIVTRSGETRLYKTVAVPPILRDAHRPLYILVSSKSGSGGEGVPFILQELHRATVIGERTWGGANPSGPWPVNSTLTVTIPFGRLTTVAGNDNWEGTGVTPDISVASKDAFRVAYTRALTSLEQQTSDAARKTILERALADAASETASECVR
jgi:C-terminal processing protease CtpA/Prc